MSRSIAIATAAFIGLACSVNVDNASAQVSRPSNASQYNNDQANGQQSGKQHDYFVASWIGADNLCEIEMNQFATQHASSQEVKDFAQQMIQSHTDLANKINQAIGREYEAGANSASTNKKQPYATGYRGVQGTATTGSSGCTTATWRRRPSKRRD